jgi:hypothetical protein
VEELLASPTGLANLGGPHVLPVPQAP